MPIRYKRKRSTRYRKKRYNKKRILRRAGRLSKLKLNRGSMIPDTTLVKLKYVDFISMTNIGGIGTYTYRLNSCFDPDFTGSGHQPMGFDQWSAFYGHYQVLASRIRVQVLTGNTNVSGFAIYPSSNTTALGTYYESREQPYSRAKWITNSGSSAHTVLSNYMKVKKLEARTIDSVNFSAPVNANPVTEKFWHLVVQSPSASDISSLRFDIQIVYYVKFFRRLSLKAS